MKTTTTVAAALLLLTCTGAFAQDDRERYNRRAAQADMALFRDLDRAGTGDLTRDAARGDLVLGPRFDDIDINRDGTVTLQEMRNYIEQTYGASPDA